MRHVLVTGFPGFIGRRLVRRIVEEQPGVRITVLVEPRMVAVAKAEAEVIGSPDLEVLPGDISERTLGLSESDDARLTPTVDVVFHLAAIYDLAVPAEIAQRVNVDGTGNVLDFCARCESLERLVYVSTAYVAGDRTGTAYEHELALGQRHKNHYEATKFQAEVWVKERMSEIPTVVLRPAIVVGDSQTGETEKFDGPYFLMRMITQSARAHRPVPQIGRADAPFNVVPVDYILASMIVAAQDPAMIGETLHLVDPSPQSAHELIESLTQALTGHGTHGVIPQALVERVLKVPALRERFGGSPPQAIAYVNHPISFDTRRAVDLLAPHGLAPPPFGDYAKPVVDFFRAHEDDPSFVPGHR